jgi:5-methyltetrahydropteroyltriglutamate--homocysteine methyltransferase
MLSLLTNTVGSYPTHNIGETKKAAMSLRDLMSGEDPFLTSIEEAVKDQLAAGIDMVSDGQVRADMITLFANNIGGMRSDRGRSLIVGKVTKPLKSISARDLTLTKAIVGTKAKVKGIITGPATMAAMSSLGKGVGYRSKLDPRLLEDMAAALRFEAQQLVRAGADAIQVDEPAFYNIDVSKVAKFVDVAVEGIDVPVKIHPHVASYKDYDTIVKLDEVEVIGIEAAKFPNLLNEINPKEFLDRDKKVALGVINTDKREIETIDEVIGRIKKGIEIFGDDMWINPDCGLRLQTRKVAFEKLVVMTTAVTAIKHGSN